jgi:hypothetical protein
MLPLLTIEKLKRSLAATCMWPLLMGQQRRFLRVAADEGSTSATFDVAAIDN